MPAAETHYQGSHWSNGSIYIWSGSITWPPTVFAPRRHRIVQIVRLSSMDPTGVTGLHLSLAGDGKAFDAVAK
jgi:hypothetical protein